MKQAKVLNDAEMRRLLAVIATGRHAARNRLAVALSFYAGLRVGEIASLKVTDVLDREGQLRDVIRLPGERTKTGEGRSIFVSSKLKRELQLYLSEREANSSSDPLLRTQKGGAFSANTLCQLFGEL